MQSDGSRHTLHRLGCEGMHLHLPVVSCFFQLDSLNQHQGAKSGLWNGLVSEVFSCGRGLKVHDNAGRCSESRAWTQGRCLIG